MKNKLFELLPFLFLIIFFSGYNSISNAQQACDIYVDNTSNCTVNVRFMLYDWDNQSNTDCDDPCSCPNGITHTTDYVSIPPNTTGFKAITGAHQPDGQWGIAEMDDPDGYGGEETSGQCNTDAYGCECNTNAMSILLTRLSSYVQVDIW